MNKNEVFLLFKGKLKYLIGFFFILIVVLFAVFFSSVLVFGINCGGDTACSCGDTITSSFTMTSDIVGIDDCLNINTTGAGGVVLDCAGRAIVGDGGDGTDKAIMLLSGSNGTVIKNCVFQDWEDAVANFHFAQLNNVVVFNVTTYNLSGNSISGNFFNSAFENNTFFGINRNQGVIMSFVDSENVTVFNNTINKSNAGGIKFLRGRLNTIKQNVFKDSGSSALGIHFDGTNYSTIFNNTIINNSGNGIYFGVRDVADSFQVGNSTFGNNITNNTFNNLVYDINFSVGSSNNLVYNNYFVTNNTVLDNGSNSWNSTMVLGGNFWEFLIFGSNCIDFNRDKKCDSNAINVTIIGGSGVNDFFPFSNITGNFAYSNYDVEGSTNLSSVADITNISGYILNSSFGSINWVGTVDASSVNFDQYFNFSSGFVTIDSSNVHSSFNGSADLTLTGVTCPVEILFSQTIFSSLSDLLANGQVCSSSTDPSCTNIACSGSSVTFTVNHFSGFGSRGSSGSGGGSSSKGGRGYFLRHTKFVAIKPRAQVMDYESPSAVKKAVFEKRIFEKKIDEKIKNENDLNVQNHNFVEDPKKFDYEKVSVDFNPSKITSNAVFNVDAEEKGYSKFFSIILLLSLIIAVVFFTKKFVS